ncbi:hypothetical protein BDN71DRAFT_1514379 [Pleurotus eryngii]|uniref:Uncharacterized protein n=1 Tax=Pleurotus eryngii TaxID=5323 RepID=A0A9P6D7W1_PLEER|nr:hypothetical protein BDN71DRAFT_1514379 [Pleurotus eryngii]
MADCTIWWDVVILSDNDGETSGSELPEEHTESESQAEDTEQTDESESQAEDEEEDEGPLFDDDDIVSGNPLVYYPSPIDSPLPRSSPPSQTSSQATSVKEEGQLSSLMWPTT